MGWAGAVGGAGWANWALPRGETRCVVAPEVRRNCRGVERARGGDCRISGEAGSFVLSGFARWSGWRVSGRDIGGAVEPGMEGAADERWHGRAASVLRASEYLAEAGAQGASADGLPIATNDSANG